MFIEFLLINQIQEYLRTFSHPAAMEKTGEYFQPMGAKPIGLNIFTRAYSHIRLLPILPEKDGEQSSIGPDIKCPKAFPNMSDFSLYKSRLRKIAINLRDGIYNPCHDNPFSVMSSKIVNDVMSAALDLQRADRLRADDLEQLLTSRNLRELKISKMDAIPTNCKQ
ncbi:hypothetical protein AVEN_249973-1 [Araneus ventricosus]|uniref:Uncharacterized protein n=1 Tax=Araneus ventricosus TaxID=182803 RepID=A0A4Y2HF12_ARAVE|nr:hypothetical protein AVEN_249973-1 [Araneus ventricosus]